MDLEFKQMLLQESIKRAILSNQGWGSFGKYCKLERIDLGTLRQEQFAAALAKRAKVGMERDPLATFQLEQSLATDTLRRFRAREWLLVASAAGEEFWTSDYPVLEIPCSADITDIFFPLTPTRGLIGQQLIGHPPPKLNRANMGFLNTLQARSAEHFVVMRDPSRITLFHDDTGPQHWMRLVDGTRQQDRLLPQLSVRPSEAPVHGFWKDPRVHKSDE